MIGNYKLIRKDGLWTAAGRHWSKKCAPVLDKLASKLIKDGANVSDTKNLLTDILNSSIDDVAYRTHSKRSKNHGRGPRVAKGQPFSSTKRKKRPKPPTIKRI